MNFEHLRKDWPELAELGAFAEAYAVTDPQSSMVKLRCYVEKIVGYLYRELRLPVLPNASVHDKLTSASFTAIIHNDILDKFHAVRKGGNKAAHDGYVNQHDALWLLKESYLIGCWLFIAYGDGSQEECPRYTQPDNAPLEGSPKQILSAKTNSYSKSLPRIVSSLHWR